MATTYELIASQTLGSAAATVTFSSIPQTYDDLVIVTSIRGDRAANADSVIIKFNGSSSSYTRRNLTGDGSTASSNTSTVINTYAPAATAASNTFSNDETYIPGYAGSAYKSASMTSVREDNATNALVVAMAALWSSTSAITSIEFSPLFGTNFVTNSSFYLYGVTHA